MSLVILFLSCPKMSSIFCAEGMELLEEILSFVVVHPAAVSNTHDE